MNAPECVYQLAYVLPIFLCLCLSCAFASSLASSRTGLGVLMLYLLACLSVQRFAWFPGLLAP